MLNFKTDFEGKLSKALVEGGFANPTEMAQAVTRYYMTTVVKGSPAGIPPTLPVGYVPFNPAPIGPPSPIPYRSREKIFFNTIKTYYTIRDLNNARSFVAFATRDIQNAVNTATKLKQSIEDTTKRIAQIDDEIKQLKTDLQSIGPEIREYINSKKEVFVELKQSITALTDRLQTANVRELGEAGAAGFFKDELTIINMVKNFKVDLSSVRQAATTTQSTLSQANATLTKYERNFSTLASVKVYFWKKVKLFFEEVVKILNVVIDPSQAISYLKELLYVPKAKRFAKIMLQIVNRNTQLKYEKDKLLKAIESKKVEIKDQVQKRIDAMSEAVQEKVQAIAGALPKGGKKLADKEGIKLLKSEIKVIKEEVSFAIKVVRYLSNLAKQLLRITTKVFTLADEFKSYWEDVIKQDIVQKAKDGIQAIRDELSQKSEEEIDINLIFKQFTITNGTIQTIIKTIAQSTKLTNPLLLSKFKQPVDKFEQLLAAIEGVLLNDIPLLVHSINNPPKKDGSKSTPANQDQTKPKKPKKKRKITAAMILDKIKYGLAWLGELIRKIRVEYVEKYKKKAIDKLKKYQQQATDYIAEITNFNALQKRVETKKGKIDGKRSDLEDEKNKAQLIAKSAIIFSKLIQIGLRLTNRIAPTDGSMRQLNIGANERDILDFYKFYGQWQILVGRKSLTEVASSTELLKRKIADFKVYERIFEFFKEMVVEMKEKRADQQGYAFKDFIVEKLKALEDRVESYAINDAKDRIEQLKGFFTAPPQSLADFANLPLGLVDILDFNTDLFLGESRFLRRTRSKIKNLQDEIPADTEDDVLLFFKEQLGNGVSLVNLMIKVFKKGMDKLIAFIKDKLVDPVIKVVNKFIENQKTKQQERTEERIRRKLDKEALQKIDAAAASFVFGLAARLFWTGFTWKNPVDTTFTVLNIAPFKPIDPEEFETAAGMAQQMSQGFEIQVQGMTGLCIPSPSLAIPPFPFQGYI